MTKTKNYANLIFTVVGLLAIILLTAVLERTLPATHIVFTVIKKGSIYALVAVSMNLLNGFTGLFSLGQAGFMLIGAYTYAIFTIPEEARKAFTSILTAALSILTCRCWCRCFLRVWSPPFSRFSSVCRCYA